MKDENNFEPICEWFSAIATAAPFIIGIVDDRFELVVISICALFCMALVLLFENLEG